MSKKLGDISAEITSHIVRPEGQAASTFIENYGQFERAGSTFKHEIETSFGKMLTGYSKPKNQPEPLNKQDLLTKIIQRLHKGYLNKGGCITFFRVYDANPANDEALVRLYHARYEPSPRVAIEEGWLIQWLDWFYNAGNNYSASQELIPKNRPPQITSNPSREPNPNQGQQSENRLQTYRQPARPALVPNSAQQPAYKDPLDKSRRFKSRDELMEYMEKLKLDGIPQGARTNFYRYVVEFTPTGEFTNSL